MTEAEIHAVHSAHVYMTTSLRCAQRNVVELRQELSQAEHTVDLLQKCVDGLLSIEETKRQMEINHEVLMTSALENEE